MPKKLPTTSNQQPATFIGGYVSDLRDVLIASALSGQHAIVLGAPGWGKTAIARAVATTIAGSDWTFTRLDPSTPPDVVRGAYDPAALLNGQLTRVVAGTPYAPNAKIAIFDEVFRANDVMFDACLDVLDRMDAHPDRAATVWATANFVATGERVEALIDRFGLWLWLSPDVLDVAALVNAQLDGTASGLSVPGLVPNWQQIAAVRQLPPGLNAKRVIADLLNTLAQESSAQNRRPHPRRIAQWSRLVYRVSAFHTGNADFTSLPEEAIRTLRYAWPAPSADEFASWQQIAAAVVDAVGSAIEGVMAEALKKFRQVAAIADQAARMNKMSELGMMLANSQSSLKQLGGDDERVTAANAKLTEWFAMAARGEVPANGHAQHDDAEIPF